MVFFDCINDPRAAHLLFDTCRQWLTNRGMQALDGPINFGENDKDWGLPIWGFTHPSFGMTSNPSYYQSLFEDYGFRNLSDQATTHINIMAPFPTRRAEQRRTVKKRVG